MKSYVFASVLLSALLAWGHGNEDAFGYAEAIMQAVAASPESNDCIDDVNSAEEIEIMFPTMDSMFKYELSAGMCGSGWTEMEKRNAFDAFLVALSSTNRATLAKQYKTAYNLALPFCIDKHYTNSIPAAMAILEDTGSELKGSAMRLLLELKRPSLEMNVIVLSMVTNKSEMTPYERCFAISRYVDSLKAHEDCGSSVVSNAAWLMFLNRSEIEHHVAIDQLMLWADKDFICSSNRLRYAQSVLALPDASTSELTYFTSVTNTLNRNLTP